MQCSDGARPVDEFFEQRYSLHPRKGHRTAAEQRLCEVAGIDTPEVQAEFARVHQAWIGTEDWQWRGGAKAPFLDEWIADKGYRYPPSQAADHSRSDGTRYLSMEQQDALVRKAGGSA